MDGGANGRGFQGVVRKRHKVFTVDRRVAGIPQGRDLKYKFRALMVEAGTKTDRDNGLRLRARW